MTESYEPCVLRNECPRNCGRVCQAKAEAKKHESTQFLLIALVLFLAAFFAFTQSIQAGPGKNMDKPGVPALVQPSSDPVPNVYTTNEERRETVRELAVPGSTGRNSSEPAGRTGADILREKTECKSGKKC